MNKQQRTSLIELFWSLSKIFMAIAIIGNIVKPDIPLVKTAVLIGAAIVFAVTGFIMDSRR